eukprot:jgi/Botrbrau1/5989/Bobra.104_1s0020.1
MEGEHLSKYITKTIKSFNEWRAILSVARDLSPVFDAINTGAAFHTLAVLAKKKLDPRRFSEQEFANLVWAAATLGQATLAVEEMFFFICEACLRRGLHTFGAQGLSQLMWGFATLSYYHFDFFMELAEEAITPGRLHSFSAQSVSNILWSFGKLEWDPEGPFVAALVDQLVAQGGTAIPKEISSSVWALARLSYDSEPLFQLAWDHFLQHPEEWSLQAASNMLWAVAVCQRTQHPAFKPLVRLVGEGLMRNIISQGDEDPSHRRGTVDVMKQLFQALMVASIETGMDCTDLIDPELHQLLEVSWRLEVMDSVTRSSSHREVSRILDRMEVLYEVGTLTDNEYFSLDISLMSPTGPVALELYGPFNFSVNILKPPRLHSSQE